MLFSFHLQNRLPGKGVKKMDDVALYYWSVLESVMVAFLLWDLLINWWEKNVVHDTVTSYVTKNLRKIVSINFFIALR